MKLLPIFLKELEHEAQTTRKFLERIPEDKFDWAPHGKSMKVLRLARHLADLPAWSELALEADGLDFENTDWKEEECNSIAELLDFHDRSVERGKKAIQKADEEILTKPWTLQSGTHIISTNPKHEIIRMSLNQTVHHRAQLGVYLRLLNIPIPGSYGPSADEQ